MPSAPDAEELAVVAGRHEEIAGRVLDDVPDVGRIEIGEEPQFAGQAERPLVADDGLVELRLVVVGRGVVEPDLHLAGVGGCGEEESGEDREERERATHAELLDFVRSRAWPGDASNYRRSGGLAAIAKRGAGRLQHAGERCGTRKSSGSLTGRRPGGLMSP